MIFFKRNFVSRKLYSQKRLVFGFQAFTQFNFIPKGQSRLKSIWYRY